MTCRTISAKCSALTAKSLTRLLDGQRLLVRGSAHCSSVMKPSSRMRRRTYCWRSLARLGLTTGLKRDGALGSPASIAISAMVSCIERLAEIDLRGGGKAVRALAQVDLVDVELEDLIFGQAVLDLEGEQHLVELAGERFFLGQEEIARDLHGDRARALPRAAGHEIGQRGAQRRRVIHAAMLVEALVFCREDRLAHLLRDIFDLDEGAPLFAEFADQHAFGAIYAQRHLGLVIGEHVQGRQRRIDNDRERTSTRMPRSDCGRRSNRGRVPPAGGHRAIKGEGRLL